MRTKKQNRTGIKRIVRRREKRNLKDDAPIRDITLGRVTRRGWGKGVSK